MLREHLLSACRLGLEAGLDAGTLQVQLDPHRAQRFGGKPQREAAPPLEGHLAQAPGDSGGIEPLVTFRLGRFRRRFRGFCVRRSRG